jgi:hypothetical protein
MKNRIMTYFSTGLVVLVVAGVLWAQSPKSDSPSNIPQVWQHLALEHQGKNVTNSPELARKINGLGEEGWQLVDVESISEAGTTTKIIFFFRRLK